MALIRPDLVSVVVAVYDMPVQALNTVRSLAPAHQVGVKPGHYEIIVVENRSDRLLDPTEVRAIAPNARYVLRDEPGVSPAAALNHGARMARGLTVTMMVDGARMVTPGVIRGIRQARRIGRRTIVAVPGYHLGDQLHPAAAEAGYTVEQEQAMLDALDWRSHGYRLFQRSVLSASCENGFLRPMGESNCIALSQRLFRRLGGFDEGFVTSGGGFVNLDFYRRAVDAGHRLVVLPGEGTFHQFHGGATTGAPGVDREALLDQMRAEYHGLRGGVHAPPSAAPILLGEIPPEALPFMAYSVQRAQGQGHD